MHTKSAIAQVMAGIRLNADRNGNVSAASLRASFTETNLPSIVAGIQSELMKGLPPKPPMPKGVPQDYAEALFTPGVCAIPLWSGVNWKFGAICDGAPIKDSRTGEMVKFDNYELAIEQLNAWHAYIKSAGNA